MTRDTSQPVADRMRERQRPGQWCWCPDVPYRSHNCAEDHPRRPWACKGSGGHVHPWPNVAGRGTPDGLDGADAELILEAHDLAERNYDL